MEEIKKLHDLNIEWGCITNLMDRILTIEDGIEGGWPEMSEMVVDAMVLEGEKKDPASAFFNLYQFFWRFYFRLKANPAKRKFNEYLEREDSFWIMNYDYKTFLWAREKGFVDDITNAYIRLPKDKLGEGQIKKLQLRCKKEKK